MFAISPTPSSNLQDLRDSDRITSLSDVRARQELHKSL